MKFNHRNVLKTTEKCTHRLVFWNSIGILFAPYSSFSLLGCSFPKTKIMMSCMAKKWLKKWLTGDIPQCTEITHNESTTKSTLAILFSFHKCCRMKKSVVSFMASFIEWSLPLNVVSLLYTDWKFLPNELQFTKFLFTLLDFQIYGRFTVMTHSVFGVVYPNVTRAHTKAERMCHSIQAKW